MPEMKNTMLKYGFYRMINSKKQGISLSQKEVSFIFYG